MFGLPKFGDGIGIDRTLRFYREFRVDTNALARRSIVVTGSNGKGSTSRFITAALGAASKRAGLFTSPHLFDYRERFVIGDARIPQEAFDRHAAAVLAFNQRLAEGDRLGAFELLFLVAILWFEEEKPDAIVWEAGIGGRYDPVRTLKSILGALTGLELEHTQILGATEELIAYDKIDAVAPGGTLVVSPSVSPVYRQRIESYCSLSGKHPVFVSDAFEVGNLRNSATGTTGTSFILQGHKVTLDLIGRHQADNALTAFLCAAQWLGVAADPAVEHRLLGAISKTSWPGRLERVAANPDLWIDVGHTPKALDLVTSAFLDFTPRDRTLVIFGVSASKDVASIAAIVAKRFDHVILTRAHKASADIASFANAFAGKQITIEPDISRATHLARDRAAKDGLTVLAVGGLFLAAEVQHAWRGGDPKELEFL
jgi:dihydrofolate synthase/folylpolyglutamate synthase